MTTKMMEWLNQNRHRSYPMVRDEWREAVSPDSGLDCVLLDALVFDADAEGDEELRLELVQVGASDSVVCMSYGGRRFEVRLEGGTESGEGSYECLRGVIRGSGSRGASMSLSLSSHAYMKSVLGEGLWSMGARVLPSRVLRVNDGFGVDVLRTKGSVRVSGHNSPADASGDVVLEDGYRTSPVVYDGKVLVRVGHRYGLNPCHYDFGEEGDVDCRQPLFFFCGQNGINSGNVVIKGGKGITVAQGRSYTVRSGTQAGKTIPCIEIIAGRELLDIYSP